MKNDEDKLVKLLLTSGAGICMYASPASIKKVMDDPRFVILKDEGNDNICLSIDSITGFEVLDDRTDAGAVSYTHLTLPTILLV